MFAEDILFVVLRYLEDLDIVNMMLTSKQLYQDIVNNSYLWEYKNKYMYNICDNSFETYKKNMPISIENTKTFLIDSHNNKIYNRSKLLKMLDSMLSKNHIYFDSCVNIIEYLNLEKFDYEDKLFMYLKVNDMLHKIDEVPLLKNNKTLAELKNMFVK